MASDINVAISGNDIKNGTAVVSTTVAGNYSTLNTSVSNLPAIGDIENKYDNRFYNGIFVHITGSGIL